MSIIDPLGRTILATFPDGSAQTSKYQGWCGGTTGENGHGKVWLYDEATGKPKVNGMCGQCILQKRDPAFTTCTIHGINKRGPGGRCAECEARGIPAVEDNLPPLDEADDDDGGVVPDDGVDLRPSLDPEPLP